MGKDTPQTPTSQSVTQTSIPEYARPYVERMLGKAEAVSSQPYQAYGGERIAGFTPMQQQAQQGMANLQPSQQLGTATQMAGIGGLGSLQAGQNYHGMATNPGSVQQYMSPYIQNALQPQMYEAQRQSDIMGQKNAAQAVGAGAFGGSRFGLQESERQRNLGQNLANIYGSGMESAFQNAQRAQQFGADLGLRGFGQALQSANTLGQLGQTQFGQQKDVIQGQMSMGGQQQALEQQRLSQQYQDFLTQRGYPQQQLSYMSDMLRGLPLSQSTQQMYQAPASPLATAAGLGATYLGAQRASYFADGGLAGIAANQLMQG